MPPKKLSSQLEISFELTSRRVYPKKYDEARAIAAKKKRNSRLGSLILNQQNKGFFKLDQGLWIPASQGELTVAVQSPELTINKSRITTYERTRHRGYAKKAAHETRKKIESYYADARDERYKLKSALLVSPEGAINEYSLTHSELALEAMIRYVQDLNSFMFRDWPQKRWSRYKTNLDKATRQVKALYLDDLFELYDEATWNARSRARFWHQRDMNGIEPPKVPPIPFNSIDPNEEINDER